MSVDPSGRLTKAQQALLAILVEGHPGKRAPSWKRSPHEFILEYGSWYKPISMPATVKRGTAQQCFSNAYRLAQDNPAFTYCEGFILLRSNLPPIRHGWVTDGHGHAIDNTLTELSGAYAGVPFQTDFVSVYFIKSRAVVSLLDDWMADWPLLGKLGDRPKEWLEPKGQGISRCQVNARLGPRT